MSEFIVRELTEKEYVQWDELVKSSPSGTIFHSSKWAVIQRDFFGRPLKILGCFENDEMVAGCTLFYHSRGPFTVIYSTCNLNPYGGIVVKRLPDASFRKRGMFQDRVIRAIENALMNERFVKMEVCNAPELIDMRPFIWNGWEVELKYTYRLRLNEPGPNIMSDRRFHAILEDQQKENDKSLNSLDHDPGSKDDVNINGLSTSLPVEKYCGFSRNAVRSIKKAKKSGISIHKGITADQFYDIFSNMLVNKGLRCPVGIEYFERIFEYIHSSGSGDTWYAQTPDGNIISSDVILLDNKRAYRWLAASKMEYNDTGATSYLISSICEDLRRKGISYIDLMTANIHQISSFTLNFNPELIPYYQVYRFSPLFHIPGKCFHSVKSFKRLM